MWPYLVQYGQLSICAYPFFYGLGVAVAGVLFVRALARRGQPATKCADLYGGSVVAVVLGGWLMHCLWLWGSESKDAEVLRGFSRGGQVLYGSVLLSVPTIGLVARYLGVSIHEALDAAAVVAPLGLVFGRVGCICRGCCHGTVTYLPWGICYPKVVDLDGSIVGSPAFLVHVRESLLSIAAAHSLAVHPSQAYEAIAMLITFCVLRRLWRRHQLVGRLTPCFLLCYCAIRFVIEFVRVHPAACWDLTFPQLLSIGIGSIAAVWLVAPQVGWLRFQVVRDGIIRANQPNGVSSRTTMKSKTLMSKKL